MQSLECVELFLFVLYPKMSVPDIKNLGLALGGLCKRKISIDKVSHVLYIQSHASRQIIIILSLIF